MSFDDARAVWTDPEMAVQDTARQQDDERRAKAIGRIEGRLFAAVYIMRGEVIRLISARRANKREEEAYDDR